MNDTDVVAFVPRQPSNKGKITGPKPPLRPGHVWAIRAKLHLETKAFDLTVDVGKSSDLLTDIVSLDNLICPP